MREALALPAAVYESPSFPYSDNLTDILFPGVLINYFLIRKIYLSSVIWLIIWILARKSHGQWFYGYHDVRSWTSLPCVVTFIASTCLCWKWLVLIKLFISNWIYFIKFVFSSVIHPTACSACGRARLAGFRYRCSRCHNYTLCQDCFWRGRVSDNHTNEHEVKEYATYVSIIFNNQ